jgi:hypothetical protein
VYLFGGDKGKTCREIKAHLIPKNTASAGARTITFFDTVIAHMAHQIQILLHDYLIELMA